MLDVLSYFIQRLGFYFKDFLRAYFIGSFEFFNNNYWEKILFLDRLTDFSVNLRYFWVPLWRHYSFIGYLVSIPIRLTKLFFSGLLIVIFSIVYWFLYLLWIVLPFYLIIKIFH